VPVRQVQVSEATLSRCAAIAGGDWRGSRRWCWRGNRSWSWCRGRAVIIPVPIMAAGRCRAGSRAWHWGRCRHRYRCRRWRRAGCGESGKRACSAHPCQRRCAGIAGRLGGPIGVTGIIGSIDKIASQVIQTYFQRSCALKRVCSQRSNMRAGESRSKLTISVVNATIDAG